MSRYRIHSVWFAGEYRLLNTGNRDVTIRQMTKLGNIPTAIEINHRFSAVHPAVYGAETLEHDGNYLDS